MSSIPNELSITINTSVAGFQLLKYKPSMTIPDTKDSSVQFNPLVKLNQSIIDKVPEKVRVSEFFNKGLFNSLINGHGLQRIKTLKQATRDGYVDNNIAITLKNILPPGGIIYINKQPYTIADVQYTKGSYKIDKKSSGVQTIDKDRITNPYMYNSLVRNEVISGDRELSGIPLELLNGPNYNQNNDPTARGPGVLRTPPNNKCESIFLPWLRTLTNESNVTQIELNRLKLSGRISDAEIEQCVNFWNNNGRYIVLPAPLPTPAAPLPTPAASLPRPTPPTPTPTRPIPTIPNSACKAVFEPWLKSVRNKTNIQPSELKVLLDNPLITISQILECVNYYKISDPSINITLEALLRPTGGLPKYNEVFIPWLTTGVRGYNPATRDAQITDDELNLLVRSGRITRDEFNKCVAQYRSLGHSISKLPPLPPPPLPPTGPPPNPKCNAEILDWLRNSVANRNAITEAEVNDLILRGVTLEEFEECLPYLRAKGYTIDAARALPPSIPGASVPIGPSGPPLMPPSPNARCNDILTWINNPFSVTDKSNITDDERQNILAGLGISDNELDQCIQYLNTIDNTNNIGFEFPVGPPPPPPIPTPIPPSIPSNPPPELLPEDQIELMTTRPDLQDSQDNTNFLRRFFNLGNIYDIQNKFYQDMGITNEVARNRTYQILNNTTSVILGQDNSSISRTAYKESVDGLKVIHNNGQGDCFFEAIAQAINHFNFTKNSETTKGQKIIRGVFGNGDTLFTQESIRNLVADYLINLRDNYIQIFTDEVITAGRFNITILNQEVEDALSGQFNSFGNGQDEATYYASINNDNYMQIIDNIYRTSNSYFVEKPVIKPDYSRETLKFMNPFDSLIDYNNDDTLRAYISSSDYWGDNQTIAYISEIFKMNIITIGSEDKNVIMKGPRGAPQEQTIETLKILNGDLKSANIIDKGVDKYIFLYNDLKHFELITFNYKIKDPANPRVRRAGTMKSVAIFEINNNSRTYNPPFYILFLIFATYYLKLLPQDRINVFLFKAQMEVLEVCFENLMNIVTNSAPSMMDPSRRLYDGLDVIFKKMNSYFPFSRYVVSSNPAISVILTTNAAGLPIWGGAYYNNNRNPYATPYPYARPYPYSPPRPNFLRSAEPYKESNISYHITIDLQLQKGKTITPQQMSNLKCANKWNSVRKAFAEFTGTRYSIPPVYDSAIQNNNKTKDNKVKPRANQYNQTKRYKGGEKVVRKRGTKRNMHMKKNKTLKIH